MPMRAGKVVLQDRLCTCLNSRSETGPSTEVTEEGLIPEDLPRKGSGFNRQRPECSTRSGQVTLLWSGNSIA